MIIYNARILTMEGEDIDNGYVQVNDGKIVAIGDMNNAPKITDSDIDGKNNILLPGFIDAHCHLGMWEDSIGFEGDDGNEESDPCTPHMRALDAINPADKCFKEALDAGVTTVMTGPGSANPIGGEWVAMKTNGICIDDMVMKFPSAMKFALGENPKSVYNSKNLSPVTRMATVAIIRENLIKAKKYLKDSENYERDPAEFDEPEYDIKSEALVPVLKRELPAHFHCHRSDDIFTAIRLAKEFDLDYVLIHATEGHMIADSLGQYNVKAVVGPLICDRSKPELKGLDCKNAAALHSKGIEFCICTDHPVIPVQYLPISAGIAVRGGLDYDEALRAITINPAKICNIDDRVGSIAVGKDADLLIFDNDPLSPYAIPRLVMVNGEIVRNDIN